MSLGGKMSLCLFPNVGLWWAINGMLRYESGAVGLTWKRLDDPLSGTEDELTLGLVWTMFIVSSLLYWCILWYMDKVKPGPYGQALVPYFFVMVLNEVIFIIVSNNFSLFTAHVLVQPPSV